jgi:methyl-accepting chemotaxis protein
MSVPFYRPDGTLGGCVSGVILLHALQDLLPTGDFALINPSLGIQLESHADGQSFRSNEALKKGATDPSLIYSEVLALDFNDKAGDWKFWTGADDSKFWAQSDVRASISSFRVMAGVTGFAGVLLAGGIFALRQRNLAKYRVNRQQSDYVAEVLQVTAAAASGDLSVNLEIADTGTVGKLASAINDLISGIRSTVQQIGSTASRLANSTQELAHAETSLKGAAHTTSQVAERAAAAGEEIRAGVAGVASGIEELHRHVREIAGGASESAEIASKAVKTADTTASAVRSLGGSSDEIANVLELISDIADRTNLLALNAAIEAARAGDSGRGFAVVASEVTKLAHQTASAVETIEEKIDAIRRDTDAVTTSIKTVGEVINQINQRQSEIATKVRSQATTSSQMSGAASEASHCVDEIAQTLVTVGDAARTSASAVENVGKVSSELGSAASELQSLCGKFRF